MNRHYWYYRFKADVDWLNNFIDDVEDYFKNIILELTEEAGVVQGMVISERGAGQNFSVDCSSGSAYDTFGQRIFVNATTNIPFTTDNLGAAITCTGGGNARIVSVYAYYFVDDTDPVTDGLGATVDTVGTEKVEFVLIQGSIATAGTQVPAANPNDGGVLLAHVTITTGDSTVATADCNNVPKDRFSTWPRSLELDRNVRIYSTGLATWNGSALVLGAALNIHCMDADGATKTGTIASGTLNLTDGQVVVLRLDHSNTGITYTSVTYGSMAAGKYAITAESNLGVGDLMHRDDIVLFRRRGSNLEFVPKGIFITPYAEFYPGRAAMRSSPMVEYGGRVQTTDATVTDLATIAVAEGEAYIVEATVIGRKTDGAQFYAGKLVGVFRRNSGGNVTQEGVTSIPFEVTTDVYSCDLNADTSAQTIDVRATGKAATTINWACDVRAVRIT